MKTTKIIISAFFYISCLVLTLIYASTGNAFGADNSVIEADYACYKYTDDTELVFIEIYYSFFRHRFYFKPDTAGYNAQIKISIEIRTETDELFDSSSWDMFSRVENLTEAKIPNYTINDVINAQLRPGKYNVIISASDYFSDLSGEKRFELIVPDYSTDELMLSNIELVYNVLDADGGSFDKAGKKLIPSTRGIFSHDNNIVYFYAEAYNLKTEWNSYTVDIRIYDGNGNIYKNIPPKTQPVAGQSAVILNGFNIASFKAGIYKLLLNVHTGGNSSSAEKYFEITPGKHEWELAIEREELADFPEAEDITNEKEAKNFRNQILYIASRQDLKQYDVLPLEGKRNFAKAFWAKRDLNPETTINEAKIEHYRRIRYANEAFSDFRSADGTKNGWRTDMGRVYIVYGSPSDIENYPSAIEARPWKKWNYDDVEGGVYFIFIDETGFGRYTLVHSSAQKEPKDYNWESRLLPSTIIRSYDDSFTD